MKEFGYLALLFALSTSLSAGTNCNDTVETWVNRTKHYVDCLSFNSTVNITLHICVKKTEVGSGVTLVFNSTGDNGTCQKINKTAPSCTGDSTGTTAETSTMSGSPSLSDEAQNLEEQLINLDENDESNENEIIIVVKNLTTSQTDLYESKYSSTSIDTVKFSKDVNLIDVRMALIDKKIESSTEPLKAQLDDSGQILIQQTYGGSLVAMSFFTSSNNEIKPEKLVLSIDISEAKDGDLCRKAIEEATLLHETSISDAHCGERTPFCAYEDNGSWLTDGCRMVDQKDKAVICECNHTTVFAVLMATKVLSVPHSVKIVSYVAEVITIIFLLVTVFLLTKVRNRVRGDRVKVQMCVASSLLSLHVLNVFHDAALSNDAGCVIVAILIHYSLLCTACWMLMEGVTLLFKTMDSVMRILNGKNARKFSVFRYVFSFSVPATIVIVSVAVGFGTSGNPHYLPLALDLPGFPKYSQCWVGEDFRVGAVIIPVSAILFCCLLIIARMFYVVFRMSSESENFKPSTERRQTTSGELADLVHIRAALKATLVLVPVLGIPWYLALLVETSEVLMFTNAVVNGLQGIMVFFVYCVIGKDVRKAILNSYARKIYSFSSTFEFSSKQRRMTNDHSSNAAQATMSTNIGDNFTDIDRNSNKSLDGVVASEEKF